MVMRFQIVNYPMTNNTFDKLQYLRWFVRAIRQQMDMIRHNHVSEQRKPQEVRASSMAVQVRVLIVSVWKVGRRSLATAVMNRQGVSIEMVSFMTMRVGDPKSG